MPQPISAINTAAPSALPPPPATPTAPSAPTAGDSLLNTAQTTFNNPKVLGMLLASAVGSGALGGLLSSRTPKRPGETPNQRRKRILMHTLGSGAAGAGAVGAGALGYNLFKQSPEAPGVPSKFVEALTSLPGRAMTAVTGGVAGNRVGAFSEKKELTNSIASQGASRRMPNGRKTPPITPQSITDAMSPVGKTKAVAGSSQKGIEDALESLMQVDNRGAKNIIRSLGNSPRGEAPLVASLRRNFDPTVGTSQSSIFGNRRGGFASNRRFTGGALGTAAGLAGPSAIEYLANLLTGSKGQADLKP
jgi:hypothetical protein